MSFHLCNTKRHRLNMIRGKKKRQKWSRAQQAKKKKKALIQLCDPQPCMKKQQNPAFFLQFPPIFINKLHLSTETFVHSKIQSLKKSCELFRSLYVLVFGSFRLLSNKFSWIYLLIHLIFIWRMLFKNLYGDCC